jgi:hypothetical protein
MPGWVIFVRMIMESRFLNESARAIESATSVAESFLITLGLVTGGLVTTGGDILVSAVMLVTLS